MLAIAGGKGGSGKTTTTLGLAAALDGAVTVVDADRDMPNLHALAGVDREPTLGVARDGPSASVAQPHPREPDVSVLPAPRGASEGEVSAALARLDGRDEHVLVDCPAGAGPDAAVPLRVASGVVLVSTLCAPALRDTAKTAAMARALGTPVVGAVLTRARLAPTSVSSLLGCPVLGTVPDAPPPVLEADAVRAAYAEVASGLSVSEGVK